MPDASGLDAKFPKGKLHITHDRDATWDRGLRAYFEYRDLGVAKATRGRVMAQVIRPYGDRLKGDEHYHVLDFQMVYVLEGWARVWFDDGIGEVKLEKGSCMYQQPGIRHRVLEYSGDYTVIEITMPAEFETVQTAP